MSPCVTIVVVGRDVLIGIVALVMMRFIDLHNYQIRPSLGKITTVMQVLTILVVLLGLKGYFLYAFFGVTVATTAASGLHYIFRELRSLQVVK